MRMFGNVKPVRGRKGAPPLPYNKASRRGANGFNGGGPRTPARNLSAEEYGLKRRAPAGTTSTLIKFGRYLRKLRKEEGE